MTNEDRWFMGFLAIVIIGFIAANVSVVLKNQQHIVDRLDKITVAEKAFDFNTTLLNLSCELRR